MNIYHGRDFTPEASMQKPREWKTSMLSLPQIRSWVLVPTMMFIVVISSGLLLTHFSGTVPAEIIVDQTLSTNHNAVLTVIALFLGTLFSPLGGAMVLALCSLGLLLLGRSPVNALAFGAAGSIGWLSAELVKMIVARPRPMAALLADPLASETSLDSFPSGHVSLGVGIAFALYFVARKTTWQTPALVTGVVLVLSLAWSRLYLGVHYPSDVLAAMLNASAFILLFAGLWNRYAPALIARMTFLQRFGPITAS